MDASSQPGESKKSPLSRTDSQPDSQTQKSQTQERLSGASTSLNSNSTAPAPTESHSTLISPKQNNNPAGSGSTEDVTAPATSGSHSAIKNTSSTVNASADNISAEIGVTSASVIVPAKVESEAKTKSSVTLVSGRVNPVTTTVASSSTVTLSSSSTLGMKRPPSDILSTGQGGQQPSSSEHPDSDGSSGDPKRKKMRKENKNESAEGNTGGVSQSGVSSPVPNSVAGTTSSGSRNSRGGGSGKQGKSSSSSSSKNNDKQNSGSGNAGAQGAGNNAEGGSTGPAGGSIHGSVSAGGGSAGASRESVPMEVDPDKHSSVDSSFVSSRVKPIETSSSSTLMGTSGTTPVNSSSTLAPKVPPIKIVLQSHGHGSLNIGHSSSSTLASSNSNEPDGGSGCITNPSGFAYVVSSTTDNPPAAVSSSASSPGSTVLSGSTSVPGNSSGTASTPPDFPSNVNNSSQPQPSPKNEGSPGPSASGPVTSTSPVTVTASGDLGTSNLASSVSASIPTAAISVSSTSVPTTSTSSSFSFSAHGSSTGGTSTHQSSGGDKARAISPDNSSNSPSFGTSITEKDKDKQNLFNDKEKPKDPTSSGINLLSAVKDEKSKDGTKGSVFQSSNGNSGNAGSGGSLSGSGPASNSSGSYSDDKEKEKPQRVTRSSQRMAHSSTTSSGNGQGGTGAPNSPSGANGSPKGSNCPSPSQQDNSQPAADNTYIVKQEPSEKHDSGENSIVDIHPKKRKPKTKETPNQSSSVSTASTEVCELPQNNSSNPAHDQPILNCFEMFLNIRKQIERRRKNLFPVTPKPPQGFKDYLMNRGTYVLASNASKSRLAVPILNPPPSLQQQMKEMFVDQEKERHKLRIQHLIEKEKLVLSVEQEILRVHGRAARALSNQALPFSVCTILKDQEVYNLLTPEQEEKDRNARSRYNGRLFLSWLQDVDDKWDKIKESMLLRHHNEAESLHAVQKMDWEWKLKEVGLCEPKAAPAIDDIQVPMVHVSDDFDLLPA